MYIHGTGIQPVGGTFEFALLLTDGFSLIEGTAEVMWVSFGEHGRTDGMGVRFVELAGESAQLVRRIVAENRGDGFVVIEFVDNDTDLPNFVRKTTSPFARRLFLVDWFEARDRRTHPLVRVLKRGGLAPAPNDEGGLEFAGDPEAVPEEYRSMVGWKS